MEAAAAPAVAAAPAAPAEAAAAQAPTAAAAALAAAASAGDVSDDESTLMAEIAKAEADQESKRTILAGLAAAAMAACQ